MTHSKYPPLERRQRLSRSLLWTWQRSFFTQQGIQAWSRGVVPHHVTSSPILAESYSRIVLSFLRDCRATAPPDPSQPVYIVEIGSGHGRLAYLFIKRFLERLRETTARDTAVKYVMTDIAPANLDFWRGHAFLRAFFDQGLLDVARFDATRDHELRLEISGEVLSAGTLRNPLVVLANYVFDSIPQDAFTVREGQLFEDLVTISSPEKEVDREDPTILNRVELSHHLQPVEGDYYEDPIWNELLRQYRDRLPGVEFLFPVAALDSIRNLERIAGERLLLLSADRGYNSDEALLQGQGAPTFARHGSISMMVDYQLLGEYCRRRGGVPLHPVHRCAHLNVSAFLLTDSAAKFRETRMAYQDAIDSFGPDDFITLKEGVEASYDQFSLEQLMAFLRLSLWDYRRFGQAIPALRSRLSGATKSQKQDLYAGLLKIWEAYLPIGEEEDLAFQIGTILVEMGFYPEALQFLGHSLELYGLEPGTALNMAVCHYNLHQYDKALECLARALDLAPDYEDARQFRIIIESEAAIQRS